MGWVRKTAVTALCLLATTVWAAGLAGGGQQASNLVGSPAPPFAAVTLKGERIELKGVLAAGKVVVLNFWGLRCGACLDEIPALNALHEKYSGRARILGVNVDGVDGPFIEKQMADGEIVMGYDVVPDPEMALIDLYKMNAAPYTVVVDPAGTVRYQHEDYKAGDEQELEKAIEAALAR